FRGGVAPVSGPGVSASGPAAVFGLLASPTGDRTVVAAEQDVGHRHAAELARPGVLRVLEAAGGVAVRFLDQALLVAEHAGHVPYDRVDNHHRRHFAAVADEVADGNLAGVQTQADALVKPLIPAAQEEQPL